MVNNGHKVEVCAELVGGGTVAKVSAVVANAMEVKKPKQTKAARLLEMFKSGIWVTSFDVRDFMCDSGFTSQIGKWKKKGLRFKKKWVHVLIEGEISPRVAYKLIANKT